LAENSPGKENRQNSKKERTNIGGSQQKCKCHLRAQAVKRKTDPKAGFSEELTF